jgi:hypothetical protein
LSKLTKKYPYLQIVKNVFLRAWNKTEKINYNTGYQCYSERIILQ